MELETLGDKVSDIFDAIGRIETKLEELEDKIESMEDLITTEINDIRGCIGDDISSAKSDINSNIDQLKD